MVNLFRKFWRWYNEHLLLNTRIAAILFVLQLVHLYWMSTHVVALRLLGQSFFTPNPFIEGIIILVDYTEIPAIIATSLVYINDLKQKKHSVKDVLYLIFLNIQFVHIFWITDEFVVDKFTGTANSGILLPAWLAWIAIFIDYLELPVIFETLQKAFFDFKNKIRK